MPFIDVEKLKKTITTECPDSTLSADERTRNSVGKVYMYTYDPTVTDTIKSPNTRIGLLDIQKCNSKVSVFEQPDRTDIVFKPELVKGTQIPFPGFPSLNVLPIERNELTPIGVNCFGSSSKYPTMVLTLHHMPNLPPIEQMARNILGTSMYVNWPMMHEAKVVAISDATKSVRLGPKGSTPNVMKYNGRQAQTGDDESTTMREKYLKASGLAKRQELVDSLKEKCETVIKKAEI